MINLHELLNIKEEEFCCYKVHFATGLPNRKEPYNAFLIDEFKEWQECQTNKNFGRDYILSLIYYGVWDIFYNEGPTPLFLGKGKYVLMGIYAVLIYLFCKNTDGFRFGDLRKLLYA